MSREVPGREWASADWFALTGITGFWLISVLLVSPVGNFPLNDDWIYAGATRSLWTPTGFRIPGPTIANVLSQVLWGGLFCIPTECSYTTLRISTLVAALIGSWLLYGLIRYGGGSRWSGAVGALALAVCPLFLPQAFTFMTEVPFVVMMIVSLHCLCRALTLESAGWLTAGVVASIVAILNRQVGVLPLAAFGVVHVLRHRFRPGAVLTAAIPVIIGVSVHLAYQKWLTATGRGPEVFFAGISGLIPRDLGALAGKSLRYSVFILPYLGLGLFPLVVLVGLVPARIADSRAGLFVRGAVLGVGLAILLVLWRLDDLLPVLGNTILPTGFGPLTQRDTYFLGLNLSEQTRSLQAFWLAATALGVVGAVGGFAIVLDDVWQRLRRPHATALTPADSVLLLSGVTCVAYWLLILVATNRYGMFFDRYILPLVPLMILMLAVSAGSRPFPAGRIAAAILVLFVFGGLSLVATRDYIAWNRVRWTAVADLIERQGIPPNRFDGGYEVNGSYLYDPRYRVTPDKSYWWVDRDDYMLTSGPVPGYHEIARFPVDRWLPLGPTSVVILQRDEMTR